MLPPDKPARYSYFRSFLLYLGRTAPELMQYENRHHRRRRNWRHAHATPHRSVERAGAGRAGEKVCRHPPLAGRTRHRKNLHPIFGRGPQNHPPILFSAQLRICPSRVKGRTHLDILLVQRKCVRYNRRTWVWAFRHMVTPLARCFGPELDPGIKTDFPFFSSLRIHPPICVTGNCLSLLESCWLHSGRSSQRNALKSRTNAPCPGVPKK
jgi:hypothetical protein